MSAVVEFRRIAYSVPRDEGRLAILEDLSFTVDAGETLVLLGRSGSGKTTALKMVNRLITPTARNKPSQEPQCRLGVPLGDDRLFCVVKRCTTVSLGGAAETLQFRTVRQRIADRSAFHDRSNTLVPFVRAFIQLTRIGKLPVRG